MPTSEARDNPGDADEAWQARRRDWQRKLRRLRLGAEPIPEQVARYRRVTWMLTAVVGVIALMFVALFGAFQRPEIGAILAGVLLVPVAVIAWIDQGLLEFRAARYLREEAEHRQRAAPGRT
jgi:hypothetical protein